MNIAFLGTGLMGSRMVRQLLNAGHTLTVYNRSVEKAKALVEHGATLAETPQAAIDGAEIIFTMLAHPEAVEAVALDEAGFLAAMQTNQLWVNTSTVHPSFSERMAQAAEAQGVRYLEAPVAGSTPQAEQAALVFFVGGEADDVAQCQPLFDAMGKKTVHAGPVGQAMALKLVVNLLLATSMAAFAEGMALGQALGLSQDTLLNALVGGPVTPPFIGLKRGNMESGAYPATFPLKWIQKDLHMAAVASFDAGVALPMSNTAKELYQLAAQHGLSEADFSAIYAYLNPTA
ncbi:MAG: NAD(P)-dependent oxidoreductase [Rhodothermales bacterium]